MTDRWTVEPCIYGRRNPSGDVRYQARVCGGGRRFLGPWVPSLDEARAHLVTLRQRAADCARGKRELRVRGREAEVVYLIQAASGPIKIGRAKASIVAKRLANLQIASWEELRLLGVLPGDSKTESAIHRRFAHLRIRGEWFRDDPALRGVLDVTS